MLIGQPHATGGSGFIGGWCIAQLLDERHEVVATRRSPQREADVRAAVGATSTRPLSFGIADSSCDDALAGCDVVLHDEFPAGSGDFVFMPKDVAHSIALASPPPVRLLAVSTPSGFEHSMEDMSEALAAGHDRSSPEVAAIRWAHGWEPTP